MGKAGKIAVSLPQEILAAVEREREASGESRSEFFRRAAETLLRLRHERELNKEYVQSYVLEPETAEEIEAARKAASSLLAEEPWE